MIELRIGNVRLVTDPALDPAGTTYDFGPWYAPSSWFASEKLYDTPAVEGRFDAALITHDQHGDNLDFAGRTLIADEQRVARVITTVPGARRLVRPRAVKDAPGKGLDLGTRVEGLAAGATTRVGDVTITAMVARHGPSFVPQVHEVIGFLIDADDGPRVWISGDTVMFPALATSLAELGASRPIDLAVSVKRAIDQKAAGGANDVGERRCPLRPFVDVGDEYERLLAPGDPESDCFRKLVTVRNKKRLDREPAVELNARFIGERAKVDILECYEL